MNVSRHTGNLVVNFLPFARTNWICFTFVLKSKSIASHLMHEFATHLLLLLYTTFLEVICE